MIFWGGSEVNLGLILGISHKILLFLLDLSWFFNSKVFFSFILSYRNSGHKIGLISSFLSNRQLLVVLDGQSSQEHPVNAGAPQGSSLGPGLSLPYINDLPENPDEVIVSATRRRRDIKILLSAGPCSETFNIVSNNHGRIQKFDFCVSVCKTNFTDQRDGLYYTRFLRFISGL